MSKAEELLNQINDFRENFDDTRTWREYNSELEIILNKIPIYLNRKDKLVESSEWECDVECYATNGNKTYRIGKNKVLTITFFNENNYNVYFDFYDDVLDTSHLKNTNKFKFDEVKTSCVIPTEQFLACFSHVEKENV